MVDNIQKEYMLKVGTMLSNGKYRIDQYLSSGGFGNTYVATDTAFDEKVAIKELFIKGVCGRNTDSTEISISLTENQRAFTAQQEKFIKEARRLRKLFNPHIVRVHDLFEENGTSYYVMDYVEGESLSARLKRTKIPMSESELMLILPQLLDALECVHNEGIWHLDLKPANIMIDAKGNAQLIDFGASKQLHNANGDSLSTSSAMAYTPGYAPSEQMEQNIEKFGPWTDLYALGATMYNLLTMQQPPSPSDIDEDSHSALKLPAGISKKTGKLIFWLMKPNRTMRPKDVLDVKQFLAEAPENISAGYSERKEVEENDDTVVKHKKPAVKPECKENVKPKGTIKKMAIAAIALCCIGGAIGAVKGLGDEEDAVQEKATTGTLNGHEWVDLGLSVKWATMNVGATSPEGYGEYFAWGEAKSKSTYNWSTYKWCNGSDDSMTKYCTDSDYGQVDNKTTLDPEDDAAHVNWGGNWRMPTHAEQEELRNNCTWTWTSQNGVKGYKVVSKTNGNSLFLPTAGYRRGGGLGSVGSWGCYWSSSLYESLSCSAYYLYFGSGNVGWDDYGRRDYGQSVRPVCQ